MSTTTSVPILQKSDSQTLKRPLSTNSAPDSDSQSSRVKVDGSSSQLTNPKIPMSVTDAKALQKYLLNPQEKLPSWTLSEFVISALRSIHSTLSVSVTRCYENRIFTEASHELLVRRLSELKFLIGSRNEDVLSGLSRLNVTLNKSVKQYADNAKAFLSQNNQSSFDVRAVMDLLQFCFAVSQQTSSIETLLSGLSTRMSCSEEKELPVGNAKNEKEHNAVIADTLYSFFSPSASSKPQSSQILPPNQTITLASQTSSSTQTKPQLDTYVKPQLPLYSQPSYLSQLQEMYKQTKQEESIPLVPQSIDLIGGWSKEKE